MKPTPIHHAVVKDGKLEFKNRQRFVDWVKKLKGDVEVIVQQRKKNRSDKQNRYYWAYLAIIAEETGDEANDLHELFKRIFLPPTHKRILGRDVALPASTTTLTAEEFAKYIEKIEKLTEVPAPDPNDWYV